jgi:hypothetical protein
MYGVLRQIIGSVRDADGTRLYAANLTVGQLIYSIGLMRRGEKDRAFKLNRTRKKIHPKQEMYRSQVLAN